MITVYISIGNSDDKLPQSAWSAFAYEVGLVAQMAQRQHGKWVSPSTHPFQNACWCVEMLPVQAEALKGRLADLATKYGQDSIAWAEATTTFIPGVTS